MVTGQCDGDNGTYRIITCCTVELPTINMRWGDELKLKRFDLQPVRA